MITSVHCGLQGLSCGCPGLCRLSVVPGAHHLWLQFCRFFQQLVEGVEHCHSQGVVHRDLRLEHLLLDGNFIKPTLKITGFGYSKSNILDSLPKTTVGAPTYTPPGGASV